MSVRFYGTIPDDPRYDTIRMFAGNPNGLLYLLRRGGEAELYNVTGLSNFPQHHLVRFVQSKKPGYYITLLAQNGLLLDTNLEFTERLGYDLVELLGYPPWKFMTPESAKLSKMVILECLEVEDNTRVFVAKSGELVALEKIVSFSLETLNCLRSLVVWGPIL